MQFRYSSKPLASFCARNFPLSVIAVGILCLLLASCTSGRDDTSSGTSNLNNSQSSYQSSSDSNGIASFSVVIDSGVNAFQLVAGFSSGQAQLITLMNSNGENIISLSSETTRKNNLMTASPHVVNFPFLGAPVTSGQYSVQYRITGGRENLPLVGQAVTLQVVSKKDSDLSTGTVKVNLILVGPVADANETLDALDDALAIWRLVYERAGIQIDHEIYNFDGPSIVPDPRSGDPFYDSIVRAVRPGAINVVLASEVTGLGRNSSEQFALSGLTPGPITADPRGVVALSVFEITGRDGVFDQENNRRPDRFHNDQRRLFEEELARITSIYMGLENIVELNGNRVVSSDSLSDTSSCLAIAGCIDDTKVRNNMMFPFPLEEPNNNNFNGNNEFYPRDSITAQQRQVLNNSVFVD